MSSTDFRRRTLDAASSNASDSLKEWSEKIKSLQQGVDEDGLQEQQRLEAEIQRSRMERANRRSALGTSRMASAVSSGSLANPPTDGPTRSVQEERDDALNRLTASDNPAQINDSLRSSSPPSSSNSMSTPISLAEFMGGKATGPRLNKHAPQLDYKEHTRDYEERRAGGSTSLLHKISTPAPVALHGLASEPKPQESHRRSSTETTSQTLNIGAETKSTTPKATPSPAMNAHASSSGPSSPPPANIQSAVVSTPPRSFVISSISTTPSSSSERLSLINRTSNRSTSPPSQSTTPVSARWAAAMNTASKSPTPSSPQTPGSQPRATLLSRPVQPAAPAVQQFIPPTNPSPAFLKPSPKEERPSITRLQGRGFVQKQVKASDRLTSTPEEHQKSPPPKKVSVLERWPGEGGKKQEPARTSIDIPKREFTRSMPSSSIRPSEVAASISSTNGDESGPRKRNFDLDKTPMRLPGMSTANSVPIKSRTMPVATSESNDSTQAYSNAAPRRLPGLAPQPNTPSALRKSSSSSQLREPSRRRSVHFEDIDSAVDPPTRVFDGNQTDGAISGKLTHLTKGRARKPRKGYGAQPISQETEAINPVQPDDSTPVAVDSQSTANAHTLHSDNEREKGRASIIATALSEPTSVPATTPTPTRTKQVPPLVAPKPMGLRRNSQPSPSEPTPRSITSTNKTVSFPSTKDTRESNASPITTDTESPRINVKAAISAWGQQKQVIKTPSQAKDASIDGQNDSASSKPDSTSAESSVVTSAASHETSEPPVIVPPVLNPPTIPMPQPRPRPVPQSSERRRSITDRYSAIIMPPLKEEKTPVATPEGSLKVQRKDDKSAVPRAQDIQESLKLARIEERKPEEKLPSAPTRADSLDIKPPSPDHNPPVSPSDGKVVFEHEDPPIPSFNLSRLLSSVPALPKITAANIISVEAYTISGSSSTAIKEDMSIFYEGDVIAIVYRGKNKTSGLVATTVWAWIGRKAALTEKENGKLTDLATRFNTSLVKIDQGKEPYDLVQVLGGVIAIRHGSRSHWSPENTALHCIRAHGSHFIVIDQVEILSRNVCSGFSYCFSVLETVVVWYGRGSSVLEREAARSYAKSLVVEGITLAELEEGSSDETFWMMLDDEVYANADYWRFKNQMQVVTPRLWHISNGALQPVVPFCASDVARDGVYMYDGVFELFVIVGQEARGNRADIRLALSAAESLASASAVTRSFPPPMHVLILPTRIPLDLRASLRLMDYRESVDPEYPDHINLLTSSEAQQQLERREWTRRQLRDPEFLPLGVSPSMI
ncbi:hypothetical protein FS842_005778 [Serendipita sp. 407]|nr:hypothetical protein FS842_005778 [Serendipita sp. 407]